MMRLFQNSGLYPSYLARFNSLPDTRAARTFADRRSAFLNDRFGAPHFLQPVLDGAPEAFFTNGDDEALQRLWARENGLPAGATLEDILLAQIEAHRTDVFYNIDPMRYQGDFVRRLPGSVRAALAWRAAPSPGADLRDYSLVVNNFPSLIESYRHLGWKTDYMFPAHDPAMDAWNETSDRTIDILFVGGYTRHHRRRAELLEAVAELSGKYNVRMHLDRSRLTRLAESRLGRLLPLGHHRRPDIICKVAQGPVFGRGLYAVLADARIVLNGAIDLAGRDRGNMRCFEALGAGSLLLSDAGNYPDGMVADQTIVTYESTTDAVAKLCALISDPERCAHIARAGREMVRDRYSKARQWKRFNELVELCSR
jgi:glycosyltransferase involved in cell wall biosynthesis